MFLRHRDEGNYVVLEIWMPKEQILSSGTSDLVQYSESSSAKKILSKNLLSSGLPISSLRDMDLPHTGGSLRGERKLSTELSTGERPPRRKRFQPPTVAEVEAYCRQRNNAVDSKAFVGYYESIGWFRGKTKMRNWKAAVRTWEARQEDEEREEARGNGSPKSYDECIEHLEDWRRSDDVD